MEEQLSMEWEIYGMKWNGRKLAVWNMEKTIFHSIPCPAHGYAAARNHEP